MPRNESNIFELVVSHDRDPAAAGMDAGPDGTGTSSEGEMKAIASCLEYLYVEAMRLDQALPAHLIGAAAECLRQEVERTEGDPGPAS